MIRMRQVFDKEILGKITYLSGSADVVEQMGATAARKPFDQGILEFLHDLSKRLMSDPEARKYSDVLTFAFWIRKSSTEKMRQRFERNDGNIRLGRGIAFHIAPSNVAVNFAYSLAMGLLTGNANVVRVPSKDFAQTDIICEAIEETVECHKAIRSYIALVKYERDTDINDMLSHIADIRIVWGGDGTIEELRRSKLPPRSMEITFADRYSFAVIDSDTYMAMEDKNKAAEDFYNDTYFSDQNACTSPRVVVWMGGRKEEAKEQFWQRLHKLVKKKYMFQDIQGINKLTSSYKAAVREPGIRVEDHEDNLIIRVLTPKVSNGVMELKDNSGYFFEYDCDNVMELKPLCNDKRCQTIGMIGDREILRPLLTSGIKGVDRVVPIGKTMDFDLIWDGYELVSQMTRTIAGF